MFVERLLIEKALRENALTYTWLIRQLNNKGISVDKRSLISILSGTRKGPKAETIIKASVAILANYESAMCKQITD